MSCHWHCSPNKCLKFLYILPFSALLSSTSVLMWLVLIRIFCWWGLRSLAIRSQIYLPIHFLSFPLHLCTAHTLGVYNKVWHAFHFHCYRVEGLDIGCFVQSTSAARALTMFLDSQCDGNLFYQWTDFYLVPVTQFKLVFFVCYTLHLEIAS